MRKDERAILRTYKTKNAEMRGKAILSALGPLVLLFQWLGSNIFYRNQATLAFTAVVDVILMVGQLFNEVSPWIMVPVFVSVIAISVVGNAGGTANGK
jgi:hypothetical protein